MHEYMSLVWLRERGYNTERPVTSCKLRYIPKRCYCGLEKEGATDECVFCSDQLRQVIKEKVKKASLG